MEIIYVRADGCSQCLAQKAVLDGVMQEALDEGKQLRLTIVDARLDREFVLLYNIRTVPSLLLRNAEGVVVFSRSGYLGRIPIRNALDQAFI